MANVPTDHRPAPIPRHNQGVVLADVAPVAEMVDEVQVAAAQAKVIMVRKHLLVEVRLTMSCRLLFLHPFPVLKLPATINY
jgi:hypothetical protein